MPLHHIYWWNVENLFDTEDSPRRSTFLQSKLRGELRGWTEEVLDKKLTNLIEVIADLNGNGPDILGVCEVENIHVLELLRDRLKIATGRDYSILHHDSEDKRGIDTALLFDSNLYTSDGEVFTLRIIKRNATRDLFQAHLTTKNGNDLILILNHWPSRSGGVFETEPYRIMVAENLSYWIERIHEERGNDVAIVLMGDFNDNPYDRSVTNYLLSSNNRKRVENARTHFLYNLMHQFADAQMGTHVFGNEVNLLDQFLISKTIMSESSNFPFKVKATNIIERPKLVEGEYKTPVRFSRPSKSSYNENGYSDHLPIELILEERENPS